MKISPQQAAQLLREGKIVAFPTETVYGLGGLATEKSAIERIFQVKGRPPDNPLICHVADVATAFQYADIDPYALRLAEAFWPGPLTILLPPAPHGAAEGPGIDRYVMGNSRFIGFRIPDHPLAQEILRLVGSPVAAPSANLSNTRSSTTAQMVISQFGHSIDGVVDGGPCRIGLESTVVRPYEGQVEILRPGGVTASMLKQAGFSVSGVTHTEQTGPSSQESSEKSRPDILLHSPGNLPVHYTPSIPLAIILGPDSVIEAAGSEVAWIQNDSTLQMEDGRRLHATLLTMNSTEADLVNLSTHELSRKGDMHEVAHNLFSAFDSLSGGTDLLLIKMPATTGLGEAVADRIQRAASFFCSIQKEKIILRSRFSP